jgi:hypothetical protein
VPAVGEFSRGNFTEYRARFKSVEYGAGAVSGSGSNIFYSFNQGLVHYIGFSAEAYAYRSGQELIAHQLAFVKADLASVDRSVTPWVVALVHKDWNMEAAAVRDCAQDHATPARELDPNPQTHRYRTRNPNRPEYAVRGPLPRPRRREGRFIVLRPYPLLQPKHALRRRDEGD